MLTLRTVSRQSKALFSSTERTITFLRCRYAHHIPYAPPKPRAWRRSGSGSSGSGTWAARWRKTSCPRAATSLLCTMVRVLRVVVPARPHHAGIPRAQSTKPLLGPRYPPAPSRPPLRPRCPRRCAWVVAPRPCCSQLPPHDAQCKAVVTMLPSNPHVNSVYLGDDGVLSTAQPGTLFVDCSTVDPAVSRHVATATAGMQVRQTAAAAPPQVNAPALRPSSWTRPCRGGLAARKRAR